MKMFAVITLAFLLALAPVSALYGYSNTEVDAEANSALMMNADAEANADVRVNANSESQASTNSRSGADMVYEANSDSEVAFKLSNGLNADVKIIPEVASEIAIEALQLRNCNEENNCSVQLREINHESELKAVYDVQVDKEARILGLFRKDVQVRTLIDAETGEVIQIRKPWYAVLSTNTQSEVAASGDIGIDRD